MVDTKFWHDSWVRKLNALERYLFLYLLTNDKCSFCGIYELPIDIMSFECNIEQKKLVKEMLPKLEPKIFYREDWVYIPNFKKHHVNSSENNKKGYEAAINDIPGHIFDMFKGLDGEFQPLEAPPSPSDTSALASTSTSTIKGNKLLWYQKIENKDDEYRKVIVELAKKDYYSELSLHKIILDEFIPHWREKSGKKEKWEKEKTFEYKARIRTWIRNNHKFQKDYQCKKIGMWHRGGETCYCNKKVDEKTADLVDTADRLAENMKIKN